jgi:hypothetical protein
LHELRMYVTMTVRRNRKYLPQAVWTNSKSEKKKNSVMKFIYSS